MMMSNLPGVQITETKDFLHNFPMQTFSRQGDLLVHDSQQVNVFGDSATFPNTYDKCLKIKTLEELDLWENEIFSRPSYIQCYVIYEESSVHYQHKKKYQYVMFINFEQPVIKEQLQKVVSTARKYIMKKKRFSITMDFGFILRSWFFAKYRGTHDMLLNNPNGIRTYGTQVIITNFSKSMFRYLDNRYSNIPLVLCGLCFLIAVPFYWLYRSTACKDITFHISALKPVTTENDGPVITRTTAPVQRDDTFNGIFSDQEIRSRFSGSRYQPPKPFKESDTNIQLIDVELC